MGVSTSSMYTGTITQLDPIKHFRPGDLLEARREIDLYPTGDSMMARPAKTPTISVAKGEWVFVVANVLDEVMQTVDYLLITNVGMGWTFAQEACVRNAFDFINRS